jgi:putative addiction module component (TIGR02574 family)
MSVTEISQLPLLEKLQIMEVIWEGLRQRADGMDVSAAERELLDDRRQRVANGQAKILNWDAVKDSIGRV